MHYNTVNFGNAIRKIRKKLKLTQKDVATITGINENTMRRLENGKVLPKQETLDLLSIAYKQDISQIFLSCRMDSFSVYTDLMIEIEKAFEASNPHQLKECLSNLIALTQSDMSPFYKKLLEQTVFLIKGAISMIEAVDYETCYQLFLSGLLLTIDDFNYTNYREHFYNKLELQLLMNIAVAENDRNNHSIALELLDFCVWYLEHNLDLKKGVLPTKIYLNASYMHYLNASFYDALNYANQGIAYNNSQRSQYGIGHLYARRGFAALKLGYDTSDYMDAFNKAAFYHDVLGQEALKELLTRTLKERKGIDLLNH